MKRKNVIIFLVLSPLLLLGNEGLLELYGGCASLVEGEPTQVQLLSETVIINLDSTKYTIDAIFNFINHGKDETLMVGFPKAGLGYGFKGVKEFAKFETWVNGKSCDFRDIPGQAINWGGDTMSPQEVERIREGKESPPIFWREKRWLVKEVIFAENSSTITRVKYEAPYGRFGEAEYLYGTGRSWKGRIKEAKFKVRTSDERWMLWCQFAKEAYQNIRDYTLKRLEEYEFEYILNNFEPQENERIRIMTVTKSLPWGDLGDYSGIVMDKLDEKDLELLPLMQLKLLKNTIYAMHGKMFEDSIMRKHFSNESWYKPSKNFEESALNELDMENLSVINKCISDLENIKNINNPKP